MPAEDSLMLKLTGMDGALVIYIAPKHIVAMYRDRPGRTRIHTVACSGDQWVKELPEEIMAMPAMLYEAYPALTLGRA